MRSRGRRAPAHELAHGDAPASADVYLADKDSHRAISMHSQERVEHVWRQRLTEKAIGAGHGLGLAPPQAVQPEANDQHPAGGEGSSVARCAWYSSQRPPGVAAAARITARITRTWLPQRHRLPASASRTCCSLGPRVQRARRARL